MNLRTVLQWSVGTENVSSCIQSCAAVCSRLMRGIESNSDVSALETEHSDLQISLKSRVESAAKCAFEKLKSVSSVLFSGCGVTHDFSIASGQPFLLRWLSLLAKLCQDADWQLPFQ